MLAGSRRWGAGGVGRLASATGPAAAGGGSGPRGRTAGAGGGGVLPGQQPEPDGLPALPAGGLAGDEQPGGVAGGGVQRPGQGQGQVLESVGGGGGDLAGASGSD